MIKVLMEFENELEMNNALAKMGMEVTWKFRPRKNDDVDYLVQRKLTEEEKKARTRRLGQLSP